MHIEPGILEPAKILAANAAAASLLVLNSRPLLRNPTLMLRSGLAALFFSVFMSLAHLKIGPSELHFIGTMSIYLTLGFVPTLFGFALGLLLQGLLFEPSDMVHLGVNFLSLAVPLLAVHSAFGNKLAKLNFQTLLKLDATYYSGVTLMVGFWLSQSNLVTSVAAWLTFAASYGTVIAAEPLLTWTSLRLLARGRELAAVQRCFDLRHAR
jgi:ABC-type Co2+ transport system permease subunit